MNIVNRIKCRLGWHVWRYYHRHGRLFRKCVRAYCKVRETLADVKES